MIQDFLMILVVVLFVVLFLLIGSILFDESDWKKKH